MAAGRCCRREARRRGSGRGRAASKKALGGLQSESTMPAGGRSGARGRAAHHALRVGGRDARAPRRALERCALSALHGAGMATRREAVRRLSQVWRSAVWTQPRKATAGCIITPDHPGGRARARSRASGCRNRHASHAPAQRATRLHAALPGVSARTASSSAMSSSPPPARRVQTRARRRLAVTRRDPITEPRAAGRLRVRARAGACFSAYPGSKRQHRRVRFTHIGRSARASARVSGGRQASSGDART